MRESRFPVTDSGGRHGQGRSKPRPLEASRHYALAGTTATLRGEGAHTPKRFSIALIECRYGWEPAFLCQISSPVRDVHPNLPQRASCKSRSRLSRPPH